MAGEQVSRLILGSSIIGTVVIFVIADLLNRLHLFNPDWPPHARFHNAMQGYSLLSLSAVSFAALFGEATWEKAVVAALAPLTFWPGLLVAWPVPGTSPYASEALRRAGVPWNIVLAVVFTLLSAAGLWIAIRAS